MNTTLIIAFVLYILLIMGLAVWANRAVKDESDYLVAGRRMPLLLSTATLFATWFGAGTLLTATDEVRNEGLRAIALEPLGAGACLILAGLFFAGPLWKMKLCTISDFFRQKFGPRAEMVSAVIVIPGYLGWIAVQLTACAGMLNIAFGLPILTGLIAITIFAMVYTLLGGMWSVAATDGVQMLFLVTGIVILAFRVLIGVGGGDMSAGWHTVWDEKSALSVIPQESLAAFFGWMNVFLISALGNLPGQDLAQRIFAARSANTAKSACIIAGILYIIIGFAPVIVGMAAAKVLSPEEVTSIIPTMAARFLTPGLSVIFFLCLISVVLSTIDSAILAVASTTAHNILVRFSKQNSLKLCQWSVIGVAAASLLVALMGEHAYELLESSYANTFVCLFLPLVIGVYLPRGREGSILLCMGIGFSIWLLGNFIEMPEGIEFFAVIAAGIVYYISEKRSPSPQPALESTFRNDDL